MIIYQCDVYLVYILATQLYRSKMVELAERFEDLTFWIADEDQMKVYVFSINRCQNPDRPFV